MNSFEDISKYSTLSGPTKCISIATTIYLLLLTLKSISFENNWPRFLGKVLLKVLKERSKFYRDAASRFQWIDPYNEFKMRPSC